MLVDLQRAVDGQPLSAEADPQLRRLAGAVAAYRRADGSAGAGDVAALLRQGLVRCHAQSGRRAEEARNFAVDVPGDPPWPDDAAWAAFGLRVVPTGGGRVRLSPLPWEPPWLDAGAGRAVEDAAAERPRRHQRSVPIDPVLRQYLPGLTAYQTPGQREAVRAVFLSPPGTSVIANLPTGAGKTLAFQVATLRWRADSGFVAVIVPTVALARDQEARLRELAPDLAPDVPLAYHSGLSPAERGRVLAAVASGGTPIVFTSPEAALGPLRSPFHHAATTGRMRLFVIDEAHMVAQWGDDFRPYYPALGGLRDDLLRAAAPTGLFRTLLLSATLSEEAFDVLARLFPSAPQARGAEDAPCQVVAEVVLRPEPAYLLAHVDAEDERRRRILEALRHLPRPLLLYTTRPVDAHAWEAFLRQTGFRRVRSVVGGDMATPAGEAVLSAWRRHEIDIVVATSAFGLGMDHSDVRAVVHACLPETIDRYYQEVGRSGRDGHASVALLVSTRRDVTIARTLAHDALISTRRAFQRWYRLWTGPGHVVRDGTHLVSLDDVPPGLTLSTGRNRSWNLRTLGLMVRAGLVEFAAPPLERLERSPDETDAAYDERWKAEVDRFATLVGVRILDPGHLDRATFDRAFQGVRSARGRADATSFARVEELTRLRRPLDDLFRGVYSLPQAGVDVAWSRGSCPVTRAEGRPPIDSHAPPLVTFRHAGEYLDPDLGRLLQQLAGPGSRVVWVSYEWPPDARGQRALKDRVLRALGRLAEKGFTEYVTPPEWLDQPAWVRLADLSPARFVVGGHREEPLLGTRALLPRVTVLERGTRVVDVEAAMAAPASHHLCIVPVQAPDPNRPDRYLGDVQRLYPLCDFLAGLDHV